MLAKSNREIAAKTFFAKKKWACMAERLLVLNNKKYAKRAAALLENVTFSNQGNYCSLKYYTKLFAFLTNGKEVLSTWLLSI
jgi:hypothetical protein